MCCYHQCAGRGTGNTAEKNVLYSSYTLIKQIQGYLLPMLNDGFEFVDETGGMRFEKDMVCKVRCTPSSRQKRATMKIDCYTYEPKYTAAGV